MAQTIEIATIIDDEPLANKITDPKLLVRVRQLVISECAGHHREMNGKANYCLEPSSPCMEEKCAYFRDRPGRCPFFEQIILSRADTSQYDGRPLDPGLGEAYARHVQFGEEVVVRRCAWPGCRKRVAGVGPNAHYCAWHAMKQAKKKTRERVQRHRANNRPGVTVLPSAALDKQGPPEAVS